MDALLKSARHYVRCSDLHMDGRATEDDVERAKLALLEEILDEHLLDIALGIVMAACETSPVVLN